MTQLTIRTNNPKLEEGINLICRQKKWSKNQVALYLISKGLGITDEPEPKLIGHQLDSFFGEWTGEEKRSFDQQINQVFGKIDEEHWK